MPKARSPERDMAFDLWIRSKGQRSLQDIAAELAVTPSQVRSWKSKDKWDSKVQKVASPNGKGHMVKRKAGGQPGNKNAVGNRGGPGAPIGNKNGIKHGAYERVMNRILQGDELEVFSDDSTGDQVEAELKKTLAALNAKEVRLMKRIEQVKAITEGRNLLASEDTTDSKTEYGVFDTSVSDKPVKQPGTGYYDGELSKIKVTNVESAFDALSKLEAELDRVYGRKIKVLAQLETIYVNRERLDLERKRLEGESEQSKLANAWIAALTGEDLEDTDEPDEDC